MRAPLVSSRLRPTRHTGVTGTDAWVPAYHLAKTVGIYGGTTPGAGLHYAAGTAGRWCRRCGSPNGCLGDCAR